MVACCINVPTRISELSPAYVRRGNETTNGVNHDVRLISVDMYPQHLNI